MDTREGQRERCGPAQLRLRLILRGVSVATFWIASVSTLGCDDAQRQTSLIRHPIEDSLSVDPEDAIRIGKDATVSTNPILESFSRSLEQRVESLQIGILEGDSAYIFGHVADALFRPDGGIAVLDFQSKLVRMYAPDGTYRYMIGGPGEGPGEMDFPIALVAPTPHEMWVVEGARGIQRFQEVEGRLVFRDRVAIESFSVRDACASPDGVVLHIPSHMADPRETESRVPEVLFRYDHDAVERSRFAVAYRYGPRLAAERMKRGLITCTSNGSVVLAFENQNRLDAYDVSDGHLLWHATFEGIEILPLREEYLPDGRVRVGANPRDGGGTYHYLLAVAGGMDTPVLVQFRRRRTEDVLNGIDRYEVESFLVDPSTGEGLYLGEGLPEILVLEKERAVFVLRDPFPQVEVDRLPYATEGR